jgi:hypothetical protein
MIALISLANNRPLLTKDQSYDAFIKSYCNFGFGGRVGLFDFCGQLGRACVTWLLRAGSCSSRFCLRSCSRWLDPTVVYEGRVIEVWSRIATAATSPVKTRRDGIILFCG